jgi:sigma-B regulation protein RsbU (phosphoserine phosphatase)
VARVARLEPGDTIFLCSDGLIEARREGTEDLFGFDRLEAILREVAGHGASVVRDRVLRELQAWVGEEPREDDLTLLVLRVP